MSTEHTADALIDEFGVEPRYLAGLMQFFEIPLGRTSDVIPSARYAVVEQVLKRESSDDPLRSCHWAAHRAAVPSELYHLAALACGHWWLKRPTSWMSRHHIERTDAWLVECGLLSVLQGHDQISPSFALPGESPPRSAVPHLEADVERLTKLISDNLARLTGRRFAWAIGEMLQLIAESPATMRKVKERGISLEAIRIALVGHPRLSFHGDLTTDKVKSRTIGELVGLHRRTRIRLWVDESSGFALLVDQSRSRRRSRDDTDSRQPASAEYAPGEVVTIEMEETRNGRRSLLRHPALLIQLTGKRNDKWVVVSLTSHVDSNPESRRVRDPEAIGLHHGGYVWHERQRVYKTQIKNHVGWVTHDLIDVVDRSINLRTSESDALRRVADERHGTDAGPDC